jgi:hypothetical protein
MTLKAQKSLPKIAVLLAMAVAVAVALETIDAPAASAEADAPEYSSDGKLLLPRNYREWIYLSSGLGMEYNPAHKPGSEFTNVFVKPSAYREFLLTGNWPDRTVFVLEERSSATRGSINQGGRYQTALDHLAASVKDEKRFPEKWAYFSFAIGAEQAPPNPRNACFTCHSAHGAVDNTFVQFYPTLKPVAIQHGTYSTARAAAKNVAHEYGTPQAEQ